jgi:hypothetical protein
VINCRGEMKREQEKKRRKKRGVREKLRWENV